MYFRFIIFYQYFVSKVCGFDLPNWLSFTEFVYKKNRANFQIFKLLRSSVSAGRVQTAEDDAFCPESVKIQDGT